MRNKLIALIARADKTKDMHKRLAIYTTILNTPQKIKYLSAKEIANIYYNRSLNHMEICGSHFAKGEYVAAIQDTRKADSDIKNAQIRYSETTDIAACDQRMSEYRNTRSHIIEVKAGRADASMSEFIKVSRLIVTTPIIPSIDKGIILNSTVESTSKHYCTEDSRDFCHFLPINKAPITLPAPFSSLDGLGFFELFKDFKPPVLNAATNQKVNIDIDSQKSSENGLGFNPPALFSKTAILKRKLEKSSLRTEEAKKSCGLGVLHL